MEIRAGLRETAFDEIFGSQKVFRVLLDVMSHPGDIHSIDDPGYNHTPERVNPHLLSLFATLCDNAVSVYVDSPGHTSDTACFYIEANTGAERAPVGSADYAAFDGSVFSPCFRNLNRGDLEYPESGATAILQVGNLGNPPHSESAGSSADTRSMKLELAGPGIKSVSILDIEGLDGAYITAIGEANRVYPLGIDVFLLDDTGRISAIPPKLPDGGDLMAYVSVQGGADAIRNSQSLLEYQRVRGDSPPMDLSQIRQQLGLLVDRIMGEGGLFSPYHSALAIKQTQGDTTEAALYLRAFRSTLRRLPDSLPINTEHMILSRRISSAFKDIPGGQILGATPDYTQRILDFSLAGETAEESGRRRDACLDRLNGDFEPLDPSRFTKVVEVLRREGLVKRYEPTEEEPGIDVTRDSVLFPMGRDGRLQMMVRSETGGLLALGYSALRGSFGTHPTIAELRIGRVPVNIRHPFHPGETITVGLMEITEAEIVASPEPSQENETPTLSLGYGISFGRNELKAISMATLDRTMKADSGAGPAADSEYVLMHTEGIESSGFCLHLKLPHYVTFQSKLDNLRKRHLRDREPAEVNEGTGEVVHG